MFVGEIGIPRREFLYDITFWQARRIIRGYRKRDRLKHQLIAECVFASIYAMRDPKGKTVADMFPQIFEDDEEYEDEPPITDDEIAELQALMADINAQNSKQDTAP